MTLRRGLTLPALACGLALTMGAAIAPAAEPPATPAPFDSAAVWARSRELFAAYRITDATRMWQDFDDNMRAAMGSVEQFEKALKNITEQVGDATRCVNERVTFENGYWFYRADCLYSKSPVPLTLAFVYTPGGKLGGFWVRPEAKPHASRFLDYQTKTPLRLPFHGEWSVVWGGVTLQDNYHAVARDQRFAYDVWVVRDSATHAGTGALPADYYCFGLPIVAPAAGRVVWANDGLPDNRPGQMNPREPFGNGVVLDHGNGEFSVFAHFRRGSVRVKRGQPVAEGDTLGQCGNSGNSSEPHLHYHLQNGPDLLVAEGLPAYFVDYLSNDKPVERGMPVKGERVMRKP